MRKKIALISAVALLLAGSITLALAQKTSFIDANARVLSSIEPEDIIRLCEESCEDNKEYDCILTTNYEFKITCQFMKVKPGSNSGVD